MGNAMNIRYRDGNRLKNARKQLNPTMVKKVSLEVKKSNNKVKKVASMLLAPKALARAKVIPDMKEAMLKVLEAGPDSREAKDIVVSAHQLKALRSNPNANVSLTKKQMRKLKNRAVACGLLKTNSMEL